MSVGRLNTLPYHSPLSPHSLSLSFRALEPHLRRALPSLRFVYLSDTRWAQRLATEEGGRVAAPGVSHEAVRNGGGAAGTAGTGLITRP